MATFDELMNKEHVANHPLLKGVRKLRTAQQYESADLNDLLSQAINSHGEKDKNMNAREMVFAASRALEDTLAQFVLPIMPRVAYNNTKDIRHARNDQSRIVEGTVLFNVEFISESGIKKPAIIPVKVANGEATPPSVIVFDDRKHVLGQDTMDEILGRVTSYELLELRQQYEPPLGKQEREMAVELRNHIGWQPRKLMDGYLMQPSKEAATGVKATPRMFKEVLEDMKTAEEAGDDTFPRSWVYVLHNYVLPKVNTASKDSWEVHLINAGYCYNPWGVNRGRKAQVMDGGAIDIPDPGLYVVDADEKLEGSSKVFDFYFSDGTNLKYDPKTGQSLFAEGGGKSQEMSIKDVPEQYTELMQSAIQEDKEVMAQVADFGFDAPGEMRADDESDLDKDIEMEVSEEPIEVEDLIEALMYPGTRTPMEHGDKIKFHGGQGKIIDIDSENDYIIVGHKGVEYRVKVDEIEPLPSTFKKMYM